MTTNRDKSEDEYSLRQRNTLLATAVIIYTFAFIDRTILNVLVEPIKEDLHLSDLQVGLVSGAAFGILYGVMGIPFARIADRSSRIKLITGALAFWSLATVACGLAQNAWHLFVARIGVGVGEAGCTPSAHSMISDAFPANQRATAFSIYGWGVPIGTLLGASFGGWIAEEVSWRAAFLMVGIPGLLLAIIVRMIVREPPRTGTTIAKSFDNAVPPLRAVIGVFWRLISFRYIVIGFTFAAIGGYSINLFIVSYLQRALGVSLGNASLGYGLVLGVAGLIGMLLGGIITDRAARHDPRWRCWVPAIALAMTAPLIIIGLSQTSALPLVLFFGAAAMAHVVYMGPGFAAAHTLVVPRMRAMASALLLMISTVIGMTTGPALTGWISDVTARLVFAGDFTTSCRSATRSITNAACTDAEASGLFIALAAAACCYVAAAFAFALAGRFFLPQMPDTD